MKCIKYGDQIASLENVREVEIITSKVVKIYYKDTDRETFIDTASRQTAKSLVQAIYDELTDTSGKEN